jgi:transposase-like protein
MAGTRRVYTDKDRAAVLAELTVNDGNIKRTARALDIPVPTVRRWRDNWAREGVQPETTQALAEVTDDFLGIAKRIQHKLLVVLEEKVDERDVTTRDVSTALGILTDKIRAYSNVPTGKVEHVFQLPPPEEIRALFASAVEGVVDAAKVRAAEIEGANEAIDAEYVEIERPAIKEINSV